MPGSRTHCTQPDPAAATETRRLRIGGLLVLIRTNRPEIVDSWLAGTRAGYAAPATEPPALVHEFVGRDEFSCTQPTDRPFPGYGYEVVRPAVHRVFRLDSLGVIDLTSCPDQPAQAHFEGKAHPTALDASLRAALSFVLPLHGGFLLHASGIAFGRNAAATPRALVFSGESGAGKTTILSLLMKARLPSVVPLSDDLVILRKQPKQDGGEWFAHATPFAGAWEPAAPACGSLSGLYLLCKSPRTMRDVALSALHPHVALRALMRNVLAFVKERDTADRILGLVADLVQVRGVPAHKLEFSLGESARLIGVLKIT